MYTMCLLQKIAESGMSYDTHTHIFHQLRKQRQEREKSMIGPKEYKEEALGEGGKFVETGKGYGGPRERVRSAGEPDTFAAESGQRLQAKRF